MTVYAIANINRTYKNNGQHAQQALTYTLLGELRKADNIDWTKDSDIPEYRMSVKADRFSLATGLQGECLVDMLSDYFNRTASNCWAYCSNNGKAYIMDADEWARFIIRFCKVDRDSTKNGGKLKIRLHHETSAVTEWLEARA
jgi:hypothetical protein